jgi:Fe-S cluster assembly ATP-binding protein
MHVQRTRACVRADVISDSLRRKDNAFIMITHYQRLLDYVKPDFVHVMQDGKIIKTGGPELALELEETGYVAA